MIFFSFNTILIKLEFSVNSNLLTSQIYRYRLHDVDNLTKSYAFWVNLSLIPLYNTNETNPPSMHSSEGANFLKYISEG